MVLETPRKNLDAFEMRSEYRNFSILQWAGWMNPPFVLFFYDWDLLEIVCSSPGQRNPQRSCLVKGKDSAEINRNEVGLMLLDLCLVHGTGRM